MRESVIVAAVRTPLCKNGGELTNLRAEQLGALVVKEAVTRAKIDPAHVDDVIFGCIANTDVKNIARVVWLGAGFPLNVPAFSIDSACGSSLRGVQLADALIKSGSARCVVVGGAESCSNRPYTMDRVKDPARYAPPNWSRHIISPNEYGNLSNGETAELVAEQYCISREDMDKAALRSHQLAAQAWEEGWFKDHVIPVSVPQKKKDPVIIDRDHIYRADSDLEKLGKLPGAFKKGGNVTAGNSSPLTDGASCMVVMEKTLAEELGCEILGRVAGFAAAGGDPRIMGMGPVWSTRKLLEQTGLTMDDIDLVEINEAFASQYVASVRELGLPWEKVNVAGGAIALGHPFAASGGILTARMLYELRRRDLHRGIITFCIGGGLGVAMLVER